MAASVLGREFGLPLLEAVSGDDDVRQSLSTLMRLDLLREARRWPEPEYRFKHALIQEAAYRTLVVDERRAVHAKAATWLEDRYAGREEEVASLLAHHWLAAADEDKAVAYLTMAGDRARQEYALDEAIASYRELLPILGERGEQDAIALVLFKLALAFHMSLRFAEANEMYQRAFDLWRWPERTDRAAVRHAPRGDELPPERSRPSVGDRVAEHPALHAAVRPPRRGVAGADDRALARGAMGDLRRRAPLRLPSARGPARGRTASRSRRTTWSSGSSGC